MHDCVRWLWCYCYLFFILASEKRKEDSPFQRAFLESLCCNFSFYLIGQNAVTWPFLASEETRNVVIEPGTLLEWTGTEYKEGNYFPSFLEELGKSSQRRWHLR